MNQVRVGVGVLIFNGNKILLGKRKGGHAPEVYATPGGHQEYGESWGQTSIREVKEECGANIKISEPYFFHVVNAFYESEQKHYVTIFTECDYIDGEIVNTEPDKCEGWGWYNIKNLPSPLMLSINLLLKETDL
jgi:8-oxo-dGTP diphosphatase